MENQKVIETQETSVRCDGGDSHQGHPAVFLDLEKTGQAFCPYCGLTYKTAKAA